MTTDNSLPDVWVTFPIAWRLGHGLSVTLKQHDDQVRYTPASSAEATIKSLRDALREIHDAYTARFEQRTGTGRLFGPIDEEIKRARRLLAKDAP